MSPGRGSGRFPASPPATCTSSPTDRGSVDFGLFSGTSYLRSAGAGWVGFSIYFGGVGHYCVFRKLKQFREQLPEQDRPRVDVLYEYWTHHDLKTAYNRETLRDGVLGTFIETPYPMIATARLSGMMLDYPTLLSLGIGGLRRRLEEAQIL